jgi:hypothetical protein
LSRAIACILVIVLVLPCSGCLFTESTEDFHGRVWLDTPVVFITSDQGDTIQGAEVKGDVEEDVTYWWEVDGATHQGRVLELDGEGPRVGLASYHVEYLGYEQWVPVYILTLNTSRTYAFVGDGGHVEGYTDVTLYSHPAKIGHEGVDSPYSHAMVPNFPHYELFDGVNHTVTGMVIEVYLMPDPEPTTYVFGYLWVDDGVGHEWVGSIAINHGERHMLNYTGPRELDIEIVNMTEPSRTMFEGKYKDLPEAYRTDLGHLEWVPK